ncbi:MAG TPA: cell surface protein SprA, partial [Bacteroidota bacterium]|nr:cell surface protein SprA [Bacteroidota bacterium]
MGAITLIGVAFSVFVLPSSSAPSPRRQYSLSTVAIQDTIIDSLSTKFPWQVDTTDTSRLFDSLRAAQRRYKSPEDSLRALDDSLFARRDTTGEKQDTAWVVYLDSTARTEQFAHHRSDLPMAEMFPSYRYTLYLSPRSPAIQREVTLDSTGQYITVREKVNGFDIKLPTRMTLEEYLHMRYGEEKLNNWRTFTRAYTMKQNRDELAGFLGDITKIDIPVPANPLLSIFGKPSISLRISGAVDIHAAFRSQSSDQVSQLGFDASRNEPDFNQQVQINVNGTVGDKLNINADWNTQRTFEYENSLRIKYTGYDDEIVQTVEAGNVSLQTPSLVGGGQALFGIKSKMQTGPLTLTTLLSQKKGQTRELVVSGGSKEDKVDILPQSFSPYYYFIDTLYRGYWETLHQSLSPTITQQIDGNRVISIDVYVSTTTTNDAEKFVRANAYSFVPPRLFSEGFPADAESTSSALSTYKIEPSASFKKLEQGKDYIFNTSNPRQTNGGYIILNQDVRNQALAVAYTVADGRKFGSATISDTTLNGNLMLKLLKPNQELAPNIKPGWDLWLKNIYALGGRDLKPEGFELKVYRRIEGVEPQELVEGQYLLNILGLDRFNGNNDLQPDNVFDFLPGLTVDVERAEIIFPTLRPLDSTIVQYFRNLPPPEGPKTIGDSLLFSEVYDTLGYAVINSTRNRYILRVKSSSAVSSRYNLGFNLVEGSVQVLLNGSPLTAN